MIYVVNLYKLTENIPRLYRRKCLNHMLSKCKIEPLCQLGVNIFALKIFLQVWILQRRVDFVHYDVQSFLNGNFLSRALNETML